MKKDKTYVIPFSSMNLGIHEFEYDLKSPFLEQFEVDGVIDCDIAAKVVFDKQSTMFVLNFNVEGEALTLCDRCGEEVTVGVDNQQKLVVKFGEEDKEITDELVEIAESTYQLDIGHWIYEIVSTGLPSSRKHEEGTCVSATEELSKSEEVEQVIDPRWNSLKELHID